MPKPSENLPQKVALAIAIIQEDLWEKTKNRFRSVPSWDVEGGRSDFEVVSAPRIIRAIMRSLQQLLNSHTIELYGMEESPHFAFPVMERMGRRMRKEFRRDSFFSHDIKEVIALVLARLLAKNYEIRLPKPSENTKTAKHESSETRPQGAPLH